MIQKQLLSGLTNSGLSLLPLPPASYNSAPLQSRCASVKHKHRLYTQKQKLANSTEESQQVRIVDHVSTIITHCFHKLDDPYTGICSHIHQLNHISNIVSPEKEGKQQHSNFK
jgi:hypothetical protein